MQTLWGRKTSVNVQKPMWLMSELGLEVDRKDVGGNFGGLDAPEYVAMNPHQLIPTLQDGSVTVWESEAVLRYLASKYGEQFFPANAGDRAQVDQWMSWVQSTWAPAMTALFVTHVRTPKSDRNAATVAAQIAQVNRVAGVADSILGQRKFLAGDSLSIADFTFAAFLYRYFTLEIDRPELANLQAYYKTLCERAAYVEHVHINYDGMRAPGAERP